MSSETGLITVPADSQADVIVGRGTNYLYVYSQQGLIEVELHNDRELIETHTLENFSLLDERLFDRVIIKDRSGSANNVRLFFGPGSYAPSADRATVIVESITLAGVTIANQPTVDVASLPNVNIDSSTPVNVAVTNEATVSVNDTTPVKVNLVSGSVTVNNSVPNQVGGLADKTVGVAAAILVPSNANLLSVLVSIPDTETEGIRIGGATLTAASGSYIGPGMMVPIALESADLWAIRSGAGDVLVTLTQLERV